MPQEPASRQPPNYNHHERQQDTRTRYQFKALRCAFKGFRYSGNVTIQTLKQAVFLMNMQIKCQYQTTPAIRLPCSAAG